MKTAQKKTLPRKLFFRLLAVGIGIAVFLLVSLLAYFVPPQKLLIATKLPALREGEMRIHFLSVGQGDCTVVQFPSGNVLVVDTGNGSYENNNKIVRYIKGVKAESLSILITHSNQDHYGGLKTLTSVFQVDRLYLPSLVSENAKELFDDVANKSCEVLSFQRYDTVIDQSGAYGVFLSPYSAGETDINDSSAVLFLGYQNVYTLLCGDISSAREERLKAEYQLDNKIFQSGECAVPLEQTNVLKVSHHGSGDSSAQAWVDLIKPEISVISCGQGNLYAHPAGTALQALSASRIYRTDELSDIVVSIYQGVNVYTNFPDCNLEE